MQRSAGRRRANGRSRCPSWHSAAALIGQQRRVGAASDAAYKSSRHNFLTAAEEATGVDATGGVPAV